MHNCTYTKVGTLRASSLCLFLCFQQHKSAAISTINHALQPWQSFAAAGWNFTPKWQMPLQQTARRTLTWTLGPLLLIKNFERRIEAPLSNRLGVFGFWAGWKSFHIPFLGGQRSASALPVCPPATAPACWVTAVNSLLPAADPLRSGKLFAGPSRLEQNPAAAERNQRTKNRKGGGFKVWSLGDNVGVGECSAA